MREGEAQVFGGERAEKRVLHHPVRVDDQRRRDPIDAIAPVPIGIIFDEDALDDGVRALYGLDQVPHALAAVAGRRCEDHHQDRRPGVDEVGPIELDRRPVGRGRGGIGAAATEQEGDAHGEEGEGDQHQKPDNHRPTTGMAETRDKRPSDPTIMASTATG